MCCSAVKKGDMKSLLSSCMKELKNDLIRVFKSSLEETEKRLVNRFDDHDNKLISLSERVSKLESDSSNISAADKKDLLSEIEDRLICASNIIVFDLPKAAKSKTDLDPVNAIFGKITDFPRAVFARRFGKPRDDKPALLKVSFSSNNDALMVLRNKKELNKHKITVKNDITPQQQSFIKSLQSELNTRIESGEENLTIKYKKGVPQIVQTENKKK